MNIKVKTSLIWAMVFFAVVPLLIVSIIGIVNIFEYSGKTMEDQIYAVAKSRTSLADSFFEDYESRAKSLAELDAVKAYETDAQAAQAAFDSFASVDKNIVGIQIVNTSGSAVLPQKSEGFEFPQELKDAVAAKTAVSSPLFKYGSSSKYAFAASAPLGDKAVVIVVDQDALLTLTKDSSFSKTGQFALSDRQGHLVGKIGVSEVSNSGDDAELNKKINEIYNSTLASESGNSDSEQYSIAKAGKYTLAYNNANLTTNWVYFAMTEEGTDTGFNVLALVLVIVVVVVLGGVCLLIGVAVRRSITKPMGQIIATMKEIGEDEEGKEVRFNINAKNEFKGMAETFNSLLDEVIQSEERHRTVADISDSILFEWDFNTEVMYLSENFYKRFELDARAATLSNGKFIDSLMPEEFAENYKRDINQLIKSKGAYNSEYQINTKEGNLTWISVRAQCITNRLNEILRVVGVITDIDNDKKLELMLSERASYDFLSQLYNRDTFERELSDEIERRGENPIGILFIDLDDFKFVNDRYGHTAGDEVIRHVADRIRLRVEDKNGFGGRFGGDEFVLCVTDKHDIDNIEDMAQSIIDELYEGYSPTNSSVYINIRCSIGITLCPDHGTVASDLLRNADAAMYFVKKNGKSNYHVYEETDNESSDSFFTSF